ncbi:MAG: hypothetical protein ABI488_08115 [Polyangiaceae bacterium]
MRTVRLRIIALLAAVLVLMSGAASARTQYLCHMTGRVVGACCCASAGSPRAATQLTARLRAADCCERVVTAGRAAVTGTRDLLNRVSAASLFAVLPAYVLVQPAARVIGLAPRSSRAPPRLGPPLFVAHCALLI